MSGRNSAGLEEALRFRRAMAVTETVSYQSGSVFPLCPQCGIPWSGNTRASATAAGRSWTGGGTAAPAPRPGFDALSGTPGKQRRRGKRSGSKNSRSVFFVCQKRCFASFLRKGIGPSSARKVLFRRTCRRKSDSNLFSPSAKTPAGIFFDGLKTLREFLPPERFLCLRSY